MDLKQLALKHALKNAVKYGGKAKVQAVITASISESPEVKKDMKNFAKIVKEVVNEINGKTLEDQKALLQELFPGELEKLYEKKEEKSFKELMIELLGIKENERVISAFPPEPSKHPHLGHLKGIILNYLLAKEFNGKFILRFEDTNFEKIKKEYYDIMLDACEWVNAKPDKIVYVSKELEKLYKFGEELIKKGHAYVCCCDVETIRSKRAKMEPCVHRNQSIEENMEKWKSMLDNEIKDCVLRAKIDMKHKNATMRDPILFRVLEGEHPLVGKKFSVWPTYDFETAVLDGIDNVNYRLRSKEFEIRSELQNYIQRILNLTITKYWHYARLNIEGVPSSGRVIRQLIKEGKLIGWDDPQLTTVTALKKRGFQPEAIIEFVKTTGLSKHESTVKWEAVEAFNRKFLDAKARRYFFVASPIRAIVKNSPKTIAKIRRHPNLPQLGEKHYEINGEFWVSKNDVKNMKKGLMYRFMGLYNVEVEKIEEEKIVFKYISEAYEEYKEKGKFMFHWVPKGYEIKVKVLMPNKDIVEGYGENYIDKEVKIGEVIQAERFGFMRLNEKEKEDKEIILKFWYTHS